MAIKINELVRTIGSGARTNKYRVLFPLLGRDFDIQCHEFQSSGRSLGTVDVYLRGREFKMAGDRSDAGSFTVSFYNDPNLKIRNFFLRMIAVVQDYVTPVTVDAATVTDLTFFDRLLNAVNKLEDYVTEVKHNISALLGIAGFEFNTGAWYMTDITIQQLDENGDISSSTVFHECFITDVSEIQYTDDNGDISRTSLTFTYTGNTII
jgi:hypothetical protein